MMRQLSCVPLLLGLLACEPPYREALRAGDQHAATDPTSAASYYEKAVSLGAVAQGHLRLAELAERQRAWNVAARHYAEAQKALPKEPSLAHAQARVLLEMGKREQALEVLENATATFPEDSFSALMFGALATSPEHVARAEAVLKAHPIGGLEAELVSQALATRRDPSRVALPPNGSSVPLLPVNQLFQLATVLEGNGRPGLSARLLSAGTQQYPTEYALWYPLLRTQVALQQFGPAQATIDKLPPDVRFSPEALMLQSRVYVANGDRAGAIGAIQRAIRALPEDAKDKRAAALLLLGQTLVDAGRSKEAMEAFTTAATLGPNDVKALLGKAGAELTLGAFDAALDTTSKAIAIEPLNDAARKLHVVTLLGAQRFDAAKTSADDYVSKAAERPEAWALRSKAQLEYGKTLARTAPARETALLGARRDIAEALRLSPREPALLGAWLDIEEQLDGYPKSLTTVRTWLSEQRHWAAFVQVASYCNEKNDPKLATDFFREATVTAPTEPQVWRVYSTHLEHTGALAAALDAQTQLLALDGRDEAALRDVARLNRKLGKTEQAIATYRQWLTINPTAVLALNNLAAILGGSPETMSDAISLAEKARTLATASPAVADTLGWLLFTRNEGDDRSKALALLAEASSGMDNPVHHLHHAEALAAAGKHAEAKDAVALALKHAAFEERPRALALAKQLGG